MRFERVNTNTKDEKDKFHVSLLLSQYSMPIILCFFSYFLIIKFCYYNFTAFILMADFILSKHKILVNQQDINQSVYREV